jgi:esterase/lipase
MAKSKTPQEMSSEELEMANEILELERLQKEKELKKAVKKQEKELEKLEKEQAKLNGIPYEEKKKVKETAQEANQENQDINNNTTQQDLKNDDVTFNNSLKSFLRGIDPKKKKRRYEVLIENLYGFAAGGSKEAIRAIITMIERIEGRPGINQNNGDEDKDNTLAQEIHALAEVVRSKNNKEDGDQGS